MSEDDKPKGFSIDDFKPEPRYVEVEGRRYEVRPINYRTLKMLSAPEAQELSGRDIALRAIAGNVLYEGKLIASSDLEQLSEQSIRQLSATLSDVSGYKSVGDCPIESLSKQLKDRQLSFAYGASVGLGLDPDAGNSIAESLRGLSDARMAFESISSRVRPSVLEIDHKPLPRIDWKNSHEARSARAAEATAEAMEDMLAAQGAMLKHIGDLTESLVHVALPQWLRQVKEAEVEAKTSADRARKGLWWAIAAVVVSVLSTVGTAIFDAYRSASDGIQVDIRADAVESLLHRQVEQNSQQWEVLQQIRAEQFDQLSDIRSELLSSANATTSQAVSPSQEPAKRSMEAMPAGGE